MKKSVLALAVLGAFSGIAQAQSNVTIYGIADAGVTYTDTIATPTTAAPTATGARSGLDSGLLQSSRWGIKGDEDLGGGMKALFVLEGGISLDNGTAAQSGAIFGRRSVVGLSGGFGDLQLGRRKDFTDEVAFNYSSIDSFGTFILPAHANNLDRAGGNRANNMIYYTTPTVGGFKANISYGFGEAPGSTSIGQSLGLGASYVNGPFGIGLGYWQSKLGTAANPSSDQGATAAGCAVTAGAAGDTCLKTWILGAGYTLGNAKLRGTYSQVKQPLLVTAGAAAPNFTTAFTATTSTTAFTAGGANNDRANILDVGVDYQLSDNMTLKGSVIQSRYNFVGATSTGKLTEVLLGMNYYLSKRTTMYTTFATQRASAMYNPGILGSAPGADNSQNAFGLGVRHTF